MRTKKPTCMGHEFVEWARIQQCAGCLKLKKIKQLWSVWAPDESGCSLFFCTFWLQSRVYFNFLPAAHSFKRKASEHTHTNVLYIADLIYLLSLSPCAFVKRAEYTKQQHRWQRTRKIHPRASSYMSRERNVFFNQQCNLSFFALCVPRSNRVPQQSSVCVLLPFLSRPRDCRQQKRAYIFHLKLRLFQRLRQGNVIFSAHTWGCFFFLFSQFHASRGECVRVPYPHLTHQIKWVGNEFEFFIPRALHETFWELNDWNWIMLQTHQETLPLSFCFSGEANF